MLEKAATEGRANAMNEVVSQHYCIRRGHPHVVDAKDMFRNMSMEEKFPPIWLDPYGAGPCLG